MIRSQTYVCPGTPRVIDVQHYRQHGYQLFRNVVPATEAARVRQWLEDELERIEDDLRATVGIASGEPLGPACAEFLRTGRQRQLDTDRQHALAGQFPLAVRLSQQLKSLLHSSRWTAILQALFPGESVRAHMPPMARFVLPGNGLAMVPSHQDCSYNRHMSDFLTAWMPLVEIDDACGGVRIHEDTAGLSEWITDQDRNVWLSAIPDLGYPKVDIHMQPGDLLVFHMRTIHESLPNTSKRVRLSLDYRFFGSSATSTKHYYDLDSRQVVPPQVRAA